MEQILFYIFISPPHVAVAPPSGPRPPHYRSFTITLRHTPPSMELLWTCDRPDTETSLPDHTQPTQGTDSPTLGGIRTRNPRKRAIKNPRLRPRGHWDRPTCRIHSFCILSVDRSKASSKTTPPHSAIQSFLLQMRVSSPVLKVIK